MGQDEQLATLWIDGVDADEIGLRLGISRRAVYTRAARLRNRGWDLPLRQPRVALSPIAYGDRFGRLSVLSELADRTKHRARQFECLCDCGIATIATSNSLRAGHTQSCGCLNRDRSRDTVRRRSTTHGYASRDNPHPLYYAWAGMTQRCGNPKSPQWPDYGGRGITVCHSWCGPNGFPNFLADMGEKPGPTYSLDRINNDLGYSPENCHWATPLQQTHNRRQAGKLSASDIAAILQGHAAGMKQKDLAKLYGVTPGAISYHVRAARQGC